MGERLRILPVRYADTSLTESRENKNTHQGVLLFFDAPAVGFEPTTNALHVIQYFHKGVDYIFTMFILR